MSCYFGTFCELVAVGVAPLCSMASPNPTQIHVLETNMLLNTCQSSTTGLRNSCEVLPQNIQKMRHHKERGPRLGKVKAPVCPAHCLLPHVPNPAFSSFPCNPPTQPGSSLITEQARGRSFLFSDVSSGSLIWPNSFHVWKGKGLGKHKEIYFPSAPSTRC